MPSEISIAGAHHDREPTVEELKRELAESREQQAATAEILRVISSSPTDLQRVFAEITASAARLCDAYDAEIFQVDGNVLRLVGHDGPIPAIGTLPLTPEYITARAVLGRRTIHVTDMQAETDEYPESSGFARRLGYRTILSAPLILAGAAIGVINIRRAEVRPFTDPQVDLLKIFADQAVIAIENTRLLRELRQRTDDLGELLEQQTTTADVLKVISRSPFDLRALFDNLAESAVRLCRAKQAMIWTRDGEVYRLASNYGYSREFEEFCNLNPIFPGRTRGTIAGLTIQARRTVHIADVLTDPEFEGSKYIIRGGFRSGLGVPLLRDGVPIGVFALTRPAVEPFTDKQIKLVESFASQAVIAIENTRLFEEVQARTRDLGESLEQQTATANVLKVISRSAFDLQAVLGTLVESAVRLCEAENCEIFLREGVVYRLAANHGFSPEHEEYIRQHPVPLDRGSCTGRTAIERRLVHIPDVLADPEFTWHESQKSGGFRAMLGVPLLREGSCVGVMTMTRTTPQAFTSKQIELVTTFADQAVIAIENTRLFEAEQASKRELQESLEYQTATSDVLGVISRSPNDLQPVLDTIVRTATHLCQSESAQFWRLREGKFELAAHTGTDPLLADYLMQNPIPTGRGSLAGRAVLERRTVHIPDCLVDSEYANRGHQAVGRYRTMLGVPLLRDGVPLGVIALLRNIVKPFSQKQMELVTTFADQAVIAIENTRLFEEVQSRTQELQESLEYQTATSEVLTAISHSPTNVQPVFDAIASSAAKLCNALDAIVLRVDQDMLRIVAHHGYMPTDDVPINRGTLGGRTVIERRLIHIADLQTEEVEFPAGSAFARRFGHRTTLSIPLLCEGEAIGNIQVRRAEIRPFTAKQIALVQTFADQAVIAIENTRLFEEVQARTRELTETVAQQAATSEVLNVISRSPTQLQPVLEAIVQTAFRLCQADNAYLFTLQDNKYSPVAHQAPTDPKFLEYLKANPIAAEQRGSTTARAAREGRTIHLPDTSADPEFGTGPITVANVRTVLSVPLLREGVPVGVITMDRSSVRPFSVKQIELVETFADQAVIAIENTRLFEEVQARNRDLSEALEQQTATSEVLKVIGRSTFDLQPVLEALVENAARLCNASTGIIFRFDGEVFRWAADYGSTPEYRDFQQRNPIGPGPGSIMGRAALYRRTIQIPDALADPEFEHTEAQKIAKFRTLLGVSMFRQGVLVGVFSLHRREVKPFTDKQIELVETFADQAVIAIENVRLFEEAQVRARELARSVQELQALGEVGRAISSSLDLKVVLKTIVDRAVHLSSTDAGSIFYYREGTGKFELGETTGLDEEVVATFRKLDISLRESGLAEAIAKRQPLQIPDLTQRQSEPLRDAVLEAGFRASLVVPLLGAEGPLGTLILRRRSPGEFSSSVVSLMQAFADQSAIALENARLFNEIAEKSRELEIASQHKSQFVANMSHELRTPLAAILGYAELMQEGFYEPQGPKSLDALIRIRSNGKHLLGLINTVLDIAKIESGQFTLNMAEYAIESVIETVRAATESLAQNKKLALKTEVAKSLPIGLGDEQRLTQVLLNLVGNAIKFTDAGEVRIAAAAKNGHFALSVTDTGPGIPLDQQNRIFEQFHQVDSSNTKAKGGTGLGLAIAKQIVEMHGGRIWVDSTLGKGSTFQMELPSRAEFRKWAP